MSVWTIEEQTHSLLFILALFSLWRRRLDDVPKNVLYLAPLVLVDKVGRVTQILLLDCDGAAPDVEFEDVGEVEVVLQVEAERVVEDVGHVQPAEEDKLHQDAGEGEVGDEGECEGGVVGLVVVGLLQHEHAHHDPAHQSPPDQSFVEERELVLSLSLLVFEGLFEPQQGGDDVLVVFWDGDLVAVGAQLVDEVDCPGQRDPPQI